MDPGIIGSLIGAGSGLIGKLFGGGDDKGLEFAKKMATQGIQMKVKDSLKAGIHPLYSLGAPTMGSYSGSVGGDSLGSTIASMGADIGRAVSAYDSAGGKNAAVLQALALERAGLENDLLRSQIAKTNQAGSLPAAPASMTTLGGGFGVNVNPKNTPASIAQNQYGEFGDWLFGAGNFLDDYARSGPEVVPGMGGVVQSMRDNLVIPVDSTWALERLRDVLMRRDLRGDYRGRWN